MFIASKSWQRHRCKTVIRQRRGDEKIKKIRIENLQKAHAPMMRALFEQYEDYFTISTRTKLDIIFVVYKVKTRNKKRLKSFKNNLKRSLPSIFQFLVSCFYFKSNFVQVLTVTKINTCNRSLFGKHG